MSLIIDPETRRKFKTATANQGTDMTTVLKQFIQSYVEKYYPGERDKKEKKGGSQ